MIRYTLKCSDGHAFESWFQSATAFDALSGSKMVTCAQCGSDAVTKAVMAPQVAISGAKERAPEKAAPAPQQPNPMEQAFKAFREHIEKNSTYVGGTFAQEARKIHLGDAPDRLIHGEAKPEEARALIEDGIQISPLPFIPKIKTH